MTKVLLIDDDTFMHDIVRMPLEKVCGHEIISAYNGKEGLEKLIKNPDTKLILLDNNMPEMTGWEFYNKLQNNPEYEKYRNITIISTGNFSEEQKENFDYSLQKPFTFKEIDEVIKKYSK
jgi:CheY-like chemotaxis protein